MNIKGNWNPFRRRDATLSNYFYCSSDKVCSNGKKFAPKGSKLFPFRVDPFSEKTLCSTKQTELHKSYIPCKTNVAGNPICTPFQDRNWYMKIQVIFISHCDMKMTWIFIHQFLAKWHVQTVQTQIRLLLKEAVWSGSTLFVIPLNMLGNNCIKSKI